MTIEEYIQRDLPFYHVTPRSNLQSILHNGLKKGRNGICVVRSNEPALIDEIACRQIGTCGERTFSIIKLLPQEKNISQFEVCEDSIAEVTAPLHNYILKEKIEIQEKDVYMEAYTPELMSDINDKDIVALTGYVPPARPSINLDLEQWS